MQLAAAQPKILDKATADQAQQVSLMNSRFFAIPRQQLLKTRWVIIAALRDPNLKSRACIRKQDDKHNAIPWLTDEIHVDSPTKNTRHHVR